MQLQVQRRTVAGVSDRSSHVMQYGNTEQSNECLYYYMGTNPANDNDTSVEYASSPSTQRVVNQCDTNLLHFWHKFFFFFSFNHLSLLISHRFFKLCVFFFVKQK